MKSSLGDLKEKSLSPVGLFATPWTVAYQAPLRLRHWLGHWDIASDEMDWLPVLMGLTF